MHPRNVTHIIKRRIFVLIVFIIFATAFYLQFSNSIITLLEVKYKIPFQSPTYDVKQRYLIDTPNCQIPNWDPFDPSIRSLIHLVSEKDACKKKYSFLEVKSNAQLEVNEVTLQNSYNLSYTEISCNYQPILRDQGPPNKRTDDKFKFGSSKNLTFGMPLQEEFIIVRCFKETQLFHEEYIPLTPLIKRVEKKCKEKEEKLSNIDTLNVMMVGIDSVSKLNFIRHFRKTYSYLQTVLKPFELRGYNKIADNTFPNLTPLLTGFFVNHYWNKNKNKMFFDHLDFIWKEYSARGYRTLLAEDLPKFALYHCGRRRGFLNVPVDYYYRPFSLALVQSDAVTKNKQQCKHSQLEMDFLFDYIKQFTSTMQDKKYFAFAFSASLTHDVVNYAGFADTPSYELLQFLHNNGMLNKTIMIFFSDHGLRFGKIRKTFMGSIEDRMPFIFIIIPEWFQKKHPLITKNLRTNERRLTTPLDVHATLVHLLKFTGNRSGTLRETISSGKGISLFDEIPVNRSCNDAFIPSHCCVCKNQQKISVQDHVVVSAANILVDTLNEWLKEYSDKCAKLKTKIILDARVSTSENKYIFQGKTKNNLNTEYMITVIASPSKAVFEGTVKFNEQTKNLTVTGDVSRLNMYGNQSMCISDAQLKKFCFCK
ncbi:uncharacterized protein LOC106474951 [Limulus polyphemus]|uniref:Uncharacterized protein LOC106474951 n=1 Tax=Limulus polyphemus TaxID=6850 RepID=A0ABM1TSR4_LIMPO|nr:uncharacterized protein LOC106474951 [Limulus polyphemus]